MESMAKRLFETVPATRAVLIEDDDHSFHKSINNVAALGDLVTVVQRSGPPDRLLIEEWVHNLDATQKDSDRAVHLLFVEEGDGRGHLLIAADLVFIDEKSLAALPARMVGTLADAETTCLRSDEASVPTTVEALEYWSSKLRESSLTLSQFRAKEPSRGVDHVVDVPSDLGAALNVYASERGVEPIVVLSTVVQMVLGAHARTRDVVFGYSPSAAPTCGELGNTYDYLMFRGTAHPDWTFNEVVERNRLQLRNDKYFSIPVIQVAKDLAHRHRMGANLTNVVLGWAAPIFKTIDGDGVHLTLDAALSRPCVSDDLMIQLRLEGDVFGLTLRTDSAHAGFLLAFGESLVSALRTILEHGDAVVGETSLVEPTLAATLVADRNPAFASFPAEPHTMHGLVEHWAASTPTSVAIRDKKGSRDYATFNAEANQLARRLHDLAEKSPHDALVVAVLMNRCSTIVVGILATLKACGTYVVIDDEYPDSRVEYIVENSGAHVVLTDLANVSRLEGISSECSKIVLDDESVVESLAAHDAGNLGLEVPGQQLAYLIYTSGTTGKPKGIQIPHANVLNLFYGSKDRLGVQNGSRFGHINSFSFDATVVSLWFSLLSGNELDVLARDEFMTPADLANAIQTYELTHAFVPNALVNSFGLDEPGTFASLKYLMFGGEKPNYESLVRIHQHCPGLKQVNVYGPSEITVMCTTDIIEPAAPYSSLVPIGPPLPNYTCYVVDEHGHLQVPGAPGELLVSGVGLAVGYIGLPEKTAAAFIPNAFIDATANKNGATDRCYRTGDLVRWLPDGRLEFMGRIDSQVKIRGFRIELDEVTEALRRAPGVSNAIVLATTLPGAQEKDLVGFVKTTQASQNETTFREALGDILPPYMVPRRVFFLEDFPCNTAGKFDTKALLELASGHAEHGGDGADALLSDQERLLKSILSEVLGEDLAIGEHDDIFTLGVHSLILSRFSSRVLKRLGVTITLRDVTELRTLSAISQRIDKLRGGGRKKTFAIAPGADGGRSGPASYIQEVFWLISAKDNDASANIAMVVDFSGDVDAAALRGAIDQLIARHGAFRTTYHFDGEALQQFVHDAVEHQTKILDLRDESLEDRLRAYEEVLAHHRENVFDLSTGPPFEFSIVHVEAGRTEMVFSLHHSIFDGSSMGTFFRDLGEFYETNCSGVEAKLPRMEGTYVEFSASQRSWLRDGTLDDQLAFWRKAVDNASPDRAMIPGAGKEGSPAHGAVHVIKRLIPTKQIQKLDQIIDRLGMSRFSFYCGLYTLCMQRLSQLDDINISVIAADRGHEEFDEVIGCYVNALFITKHLGALETTEEYLRGVHEAAMDMLANQDVPQMVINEMFPPSVTGTKALAFAYQAGIAFGGDFAPGITFDIEELYPGPADDATLIMEEQRDGVLAHFRVNPAFADERAARCIVDSFFTLVESVAENLDAYANHVQVVSPAENLRLLETSKATQGWDYHGSLIGQLVEQMEATPDRVAISDVNGCLTYAELNESTAAMAGALRAKMDEIDPMGRYVALCIDRSKETTQAIIAIMRAGFGYVSLDPAQPDDRLRFIAEHSGAKLIISQVSKQEVFEGLESTVLAPEAFKGSSAKPITAHLSTPGGAAWVIFTSGTTGRPKGVEITQRNAARFLVMFKERYGIEESDVFTASASFSFDYSTIENFVPLSSGARVYIVASAVLVEPSALVDVIETQEITVFSQTPAAFQNVIEVARDRGGLKHWPRYVNLGGESLVIENLEGWFGIEGSDATTVMNLYGITETTVMSCCYPVTRADLGVHRFTPIGTPFADQSFYVLDATRNVVPDGVMGELYIGGGGIADGYIGQLELSRSRFLIDPFVEDANSMMYKSGDLVIRDDDGVIHYVGRTDSQINMRGIRIELGEIESVLSSHEAINKCYITDFTPPGGDQMIVAYWTPEAGVSIEDDLVGSFKKHLGELLPKYMIPSKFMGLDSLPLTTNGKVNKKALPNPMLGGDREIIPPSTDVQRHLVDMWAEILKRPSDEIGVTDSFYEIGGNSLLLARVLFRLRKELPDLEFDNAAVHATPTILTMAGDATDTPRVDPIEMALADCELPKTMPAIQSAPSEAYSQPASMLVTGTTGFLGAHLVARILTETKANVVCAVRGANGLERQRDMLVQLGIMPDDDVFRQRVSCASMDLSKPRLGLEDKAWAALADSIDGIIHCGAWVHHVFDYPTLRAANVNSTKALLELAVSAKEASPMAFVSTISSASVVEGSVLPEVGPGPEPLSDMGYILSKYVSERVVAAYLDQGGSATVVRPGNISADTRTGISLPDKNHVMLLIKGSLQMGIGPRSVWGDEYIDISPVNEVAAATCALALDQHSIGGWWHLFNPNRTLWTDIWACLRSLGYEVETTDHRTWATNVQDVDESNALFPITTHHTPDQEADDMAFDSKLTTVRLAELGAGFSKIDEAMLAKSFGWLATSGFLPQPVVAPVS